MTIKRIVGLIIFTCFVTLQHVQARAREPFTTDQYLGTWYDVGIILSREDQFNPITCQWAEATMQDRKDGSFYDDLMVLYNGRYNVFEGVGNIINSDLHISYTNHPGGQLTYSVERFDNGNVLILHDKNRGHEKSAALLSRDPIPKHISLEARMAFENLADAVGGYAHYIDNEVCAKNIRHID